MGVAFEAGSPPPRVRTSHRKGSRTAWPLLISLLVTACVGPNLGAARRGLLRWGSEGYLEELETQSRNQARYQGLERRLIWAATLESWTFRQARAAAWANLRRLSDPELDDLLAVERVESERFVDFFVAFFTENPEWNDLSASESIWRIELLPESGRPLLPLQVEWVQPDANLRVLYPYLGNFGKAYRVRFPAKDAEGRPYLDPCAEWVALRVSSALAHGELVWPARGGLGPEPLECPEAGKKRDM